MSDTLEQTKAKPPVLANLDLSGDPTEHVPISKQLKNG